MDRIDSYNYQVYAGKRYFTDGPPGTWINAEWLTAVQEEICAVIEGMGITLEKSENDQLLQAIRAFAVPDWVSPWYNVTDYGAKPLAAIADSDGTDSGIAISRTINNANAGTGSIRYMIFPPGLYDCRSQVYFGEAHALFDTSNQAQSFKATLIEGYGSRLRFRGTSNGIVMYGGANDERPYIGDYTRSAPTWTNWGSLEYSRLVAPLALWDSLTGGETANVQALYPGTKGPETEQETVFSIRNLCLDMDAVTLAAKAPIFIYPQYWISSIDESYFAQLGIGRQRYSSLYNVYAVIYSATVGGEMIISRRRSTTGQGHLNWYQYMFRRNMTYAQAVEYKATAYAIGL